MWLEGAAPGDFNAGFCVWSLVATDILAPGATQTLPYVLWLTGLEGWGSWDFPFEEPAGEFGGGCLFRLSGVTWKVES